VVSAAAGVSLETAAIIVKAMALGLTAVPGVAIWRGAHRLAIRIAESISPTSARPAGTMDADLAGSELIAGIFEIAIVFGAATFLLAIVAPFMSLYEGLAVMMIVVTGLAIVIWRALYWFTQLPAYSISSAVCQVRFQDQKLASISKEFLIRPNFPRQTEITFGGMGADGKLQNFQWNSRPIPADRIIERPKEVYTVSVSFQTPLTWWKAFTGTLSYEAVDSYRSSSEWQGFSVEHPTLRLDLTIDFPKTKPCRPQSVFAHKVLGA